MNCLIRVIHGPDTGLEYKVQPGVNVIGRGNRASLRLSPEDVSWEHAVVTREGDDFFIENLSAQGTWVGDARIAGRVRLRPRDKVRLTGDTVLRLEREEGGGLLGSRGFLATALLVMIGVGVAVAFYSPGGTQTAAGGDDWQGAHAALTPWIKLQADKRRIPREALALFNEAWRLEQAHDYASSHKQWLRMQVVLASSEPTLKCLHLAEREGTTYRSINKLLRPPADGPRPELSDEESATALAQFVNRRLAFSTKESAKKKGMFSS